MSRLEVTKLNQLNAIGPESDEEVVSKLYMIVALEPGASGEDTSNKQGHVSAQILRRS